MTVMSSISGRLRAGGHWLRVANDEYDTSSNIKPITAPFVHTSVVKDGPVWARAY